MKLTVIGFGQCGGRIADEFAYLNLKAKLQRRIEITPGVLAVNTDAADLSGLKHISSDYRHRILIGTTESGGHGVGKINERGAEIAKQDSDKIFDAIRQTKNFFESDAFLFIAGCGGGTGSGALPVITRAMRERYPDKPVFDLLVLPFAHEEANEERTTYNTALCLKAVNSVANATILFDNQRYIRKDASLRNNLAKINHLIAESFYDMLCAGEETKLRHIGAKTLDAGDIAQTLSGWTVLGYGKQSMPKFDFSFMNRRTDFRRKGTQTHRGMQALDQAIADLSLDCSPADAGKAIYLISAPANEVNMDLNREFGEYLKGIAPKAIIRNGDYPTDRDLLTVTLLFSDLSNVERVKQYYAKTLELIPEFQRRETEKAASLKNMEDMSKDIPSLLK